MSTPRTKQVGDGSGPRFVVQRVGYRNLVLRVDIANTTSVATMGQHNHF